MSFLERAIRRGVSDAVGKAIGNAVQQAVEPKATELANQAAQKIDQVSRPAPAQTASGDLEGALGNLQRSMEGYATQAAKNMKVCPNCGRPTSAEKKFCPDCGTALPQQTLAQGSLCPGCGTQNNIGTKFCENCGTKLPAAIAEEQSKASRDATLMAQWEQQLPQYPKWNCGGSDFNFEQIDGGYTMFAASFSGDPNAAYVAVKEYRQCLLGNGFRQAGQYPSIEHLYKKENGICYHVDTEHCFDGDSDCPTIYFNCEEPCGGFDYVKPEPKKKASFFDLFK